AKAERPVEVVVDDADVPLPIRGHEVARQVRPTAHTQVVRLQVPGGEELTASLLLLSPDVLNQQILPSARVTTLGVDGIGEPDLLFRILEPVAALANGRIELRRAGGASLGDDLDDARRRLRSIERCRRRSLDDLDALDVVRVQVVQRRAAAPRPQLRTRPRLVIDTDAVDVDQRLASHRDRGDPTDPHRGAGPDVSVGTREAESRLPRA